MPENAASRILFNGLTGKEGRRARRGTSLRADSFPDINKEMSMAHETPKPGPAGTTDQFPRWEGPEETRPRGYLPAVDDPKTDRDAAGENLNDPDRYTVTDAGKTKGDR
jgi:hypothetical protein